MRVDSRSEIKWCRIGIIMMMQNSKYQLRNSVSELWRSDAKFEPSRGRIWNIEMRIRFWIFRGIDAELVLVGDELMQNLKHRDAKFVLIGNELMQNLKQFNTELVLIGDELMQNLKHRMQNWPLQFYPSIAPVTADAKLH